MGYFPAEKFSRIIGDSLYADVKSSLNVKSVAVGVILGISVSKLWNLINRTIAKRFNKKSDVLSEGLFFSPKKLVCTTKCDTDMSENPQNAFIPCNSCSLKRICSMLGEANHQLDICMYLITSHAISNVILELFRRGVRVRIILDKHMSMDAHGADVIALRKEYVPIKLIDSCHIMHNKFAVMDQEAVMSGSLNWTRQGLYGNYENVILLTDKNVAKKFSGYFQFLWDLEEG